MVAEKTIESIDDNETMLQIVHKHWFGLIIVYVEIGLGFVAAAVLLWLMLPIVMTHSDSYEIRRTFSVFLGAGAILTWLVLVLFTYIYRQSKLIITNKNLTQIVQHGLFNRQVSELSMADVEDVTAHKKGFFANFFDYGGLLVETAGETENFEFTMCPKPDVYGKTVLDAREQFLGRGETE